MSYISTIKELLDEKGMVEIPTELLLGVEWYGAQIPIEFRLPLRKLCNDVGARYCDYSQETRALLFIAL